MGKKMRVGWETREEDHLRKCGETGRTASRFFIGRRETENGKTGRIQCLCVVLMTDILSFRPIQFPMP